MRVSADFQVISAPLEIFLSSVKKYVATRKQVVKARELSDCSTERVWIKEDLALQFRIEIESHRNFVLNVIRHKWLARR